MVLLYHNTDEADAILREGFRDYVCDYGTRDFTATGVRLTVGIHEGSGYTGYDVLEIEMPGHFPTSEYELFEEGGSLDQYCIPALALNALNKLGKVRRLPHREVVESEERRLRDALKRVASGDGSGYLESKLHGAQRLVREILLSKDSGQAARRAERE